MAFPSMTFPSNIVGPVPASANKSMVPPGLEAKTLVMLRERFLNTVWGQIQAMNEIKGEAEKAAGEEFIKNHEEPARVLRRFSQRIGTLIQEREKHKYKVVQDYDEAIVTARQRPGKPRRRAKRK